MSPADPRRFHDWAVASEPFLPSRLPDLMSAPTADFYQGQHCLQFLRFARNSIGADIVAHDERPMLHTWVGVHNRLPAADASGGAAQVCALKIASILAFTHFCFSSAAGFRSGFTGQLRLPLFWRRPAWGHASGYKSRRDQPAVSATAVVQLPAILLVHAIGRAVQGGDAMSTPSQRCDCAKSSLGAGPDCSETSAWFDEELAASAFKDVRLGKRLRAWLASSISNWAT
jgi:hypothetical protein